MKITTKTGDKGETSLFGGRRVSKASSFIELVGELDELQAVVGWCRVEAARDITKINRLDRRDIPSANRGKFFEAINMVLERAVDDIYRMMSIVSFEMNCPKNIQPIGEKDVEFLEKEMAKYEKAVGNLNKFVRPGGSEISARLHIARTVCRRVERRAVGVMEGVGKKLGSDNKEALAKIIKYLNRLSDLLFVMAYSLCHT